METAGRWTAITLITPIGRWWSWWLRFNWWRLHGGRSRGRRTGAEAKLDRLSFIGFAHWSILRLPQPYLLFQSNFNGAAKQYVEAFSRVLTWAMRAMWGGARGVPGPLPVA